MPVLYPTLTCARGPHSGGMCTAPYGAIKQKGVLCDMFQLFRRKINGQSPASGDRRRQQGKSGEGALSALQSLRQTEQAHAANYPEARHTTEPAALAALDAGDVKLVATKG